jgi:hypothetical protein
MVEYKIRLNEHTKGRGTALLCPYKYHVQSTGFDITTASLFTYPKFIWQRIVEVFTYPTLTFV